MRCNRCAVLAVVACVEMPMGAYVHAIKRALDTVPVVMWCCMGCDDLM